MDAYKTTTHISGDSLTLHVPPEFERKDVEVILKQLFGSWEDHRTAEEIIAEIYSARTFGREIEVL